MEEEEERSPDQVSRERAVEGALARMVRREFEIRIGEREGCVWRRRESCERKCVPTPPVPVEGCVLGW